MEIMDAFVAEAIELADTNVGADEENELREVIQKVCVANEVELTKVQEDIAVLCFVAGRTYQAQSEQEFIIPMSLVEPFMEFLVQRGAP